MLRYHKKIYFPPDSKVNLQQFTCKLNKTTWRYSKHCVDILKYRAYNIKDILLYIRDLKLDNKNIFEYYMDDLEITKAVYRIDYKGYFDLILVIDKEKTIITIYINDKKDNHDTLNKTLYVKNEIYSNMLLTNVKI